MGEESGGVENGGVGHVRGGDIVGAASGAEEEVLAGGPAVGEDGLEHVVEFFAWVRDGGEGVRGVGGAVPPPFAAEAILVVRGAVHQAGGLQGAVCGEGVGVSVAGHGDDDVRLGEGLGGDKGLEVVRHVDGLGLESGARGDERAVGSEVGEGLEVALDHGEGGGDVLLVG